MPRGGRLEAFKFAVYLGIPALTVYFINTPETMQKLIEHERFIVYPPEGDRPPRGTKEEIEAAMAKLRPKEQSSSLSSAVSDRATEVTSQQQKGVQTWSQWLFGSK